MTNDDVQVPEDAGEYADALAAILRRIPPECGRRIGVGPGWYPLLAALDAELGDLVPGYAVLRVDERCAVLRYGIDWSGPVQVIRGFAEAIIGGAVLTAAMGATSDVAGIAHAMLVPAACFVIILLFASRHWTGTRRMGR